MFSDEPCLLSEFGLTVAPSASIRKKLLKYMNLKCYFRKFFDMISRVSDAGFKFWANWLDHFKKAA
ncbi:hypothetical protein AGR1A_Cc60285 [Agrobacterium fabacearum CFBP 5771]|nr:hypothetical protein AGR1A_Cc60285 [Agrobacterium fabacearum CFBP 5771]